VLALAKRYGQAWKTAVWGATRRVTDVVASCRNDQATTAAIPVASAEAR